MNAVEIGEAVRTARELKGWTQEKLAEMAGGIGQSSVGRVEAGDFKRSPSVLPAICSALSLPMLDLDGKGGATVAFLPKAKIIGERDFPVYASAEGGPGEIIRSTDPIDFIPRPSPVSHVREAYGLLVTGDSMWPEYKNGEMALVNPKLPVVSDEVHIFYAELEGEARASIKHLRRATSDQWLVLQHNPAKNFTLPRRDWQWAHRVFGKHARG